MPRTDFAHEVAAAWEVPGAAIAIAQAMDPAGRDAFGLTPVVRGEGAVLDCARVELQLSLSKVSPSERMASEQKTPYPTLLMRRMQPLYLGLPLPSLLVFT